MKYTEKEFDGMFNDIIKEVKLTVENYRKQIDKRIKVKDLKLKNINMTEMSSFREWLNLMEPEQSQINVLIAKSRLIEIPEYKTIPSYGDHMTFETFKEFCMEGGFIDSDGSGNYATKNEITTIEISPFDIMHNLYRNDFSHVVWFNK